MTGTACGQPLQWPGPGSHAIAYLKNYTLRFNSAHWAEWMKITLGRVRTPCKGLANTLGTVPGRAGQAAARVTTGLQG